MPARVISSLGASYGIIGIIVSVFAGSAGLDVLSVGFICLIFAFRSTFFW